MAVLFSIPIHYREGNYGIKDFGTKDLDEDSADSIDFDYDAQYQILEYDAPVWEGRRAVRLYLIPEDELRKTVNASYDQSGQLSKITFLLNNQESLLYIRYEDVEDAKQKIRDFAIRDADDIARRICACTDVVARLFIDYFWDGEALDFHASLATPAQKEAVEKEAIEKKYRYSDMAADNSGNYASDFIYGDNQTLAVMIYCAENDEITLSWYAFDIMSERVREQCVDRLQKSEDFKFISDAYD